ncbi:hypothetical protein PHMEG_00040373 [Phytophthora megakarya]|uniref:Uncharacterized protein n=1 Tax=Phytophthora megakarya TaxID=4795 RepID=A0A225UDN8_9STRA|nr:hypothetical protein PHMEG_00040373 [Phytophthora megakarya]
MRVYFEANRHVIWNYQTFSVILENEGFTECRALVMILGHGKNNQYGRREFGSCIRHRNVEVCPLGSLPCIFSFDVPENCYDIKVLKSGKSPATSMTYRAHYDATIKVWRSGLAEIADCRCPTRGGPTNGGGTPNVR